MDCLGMICVPEEAPAFYICRENHFYNCFVCTTMYTVHFSVYIVLNIYKNTFTFVIHYCRFFYNFLPHNINNKYIVPLVFFTRAFKHLTYAFKLTTQCRD